MIQVTGEVNFPGAVVRTRNRCSCKSEFSTLVTRVDPGMKSNFFAVFQPLLQRPRFTKRNHERE